MKKMLTPAPVPVACPHCGLAGEAFNFSLCPEWYAHSLDDNDLMNAGILTEYQCDGSSCGKSF